MSAPAPEFSRPVALARLRREPHRQEIAADAAEREKLARRFGLVALDRLTAFVELRQSADGTVLLEADFAAAFVQECVVSLEPVPSELAGRFALRYGPAGAAEREIPFDEDEPAFEPLPAAAIDIGEAVAQELSLALPEFPRDPDAVLAASSAAEPEGGSFAALARLRKPPGG